MIDVTRIRPILEQGLRDIYTWYASETSLFLKSIFSVVGFSGEQYRTGDYYLPPASLASIPSKPEKKPGDKCRNTKHKILKEIREKFDSFSTPFLETLHINQLYYLCETYGSYIPSGEDQYVSLFDACKLSCARALVFNNEKNKECLIIHVDISGIQDFIYTIISKGALKNLRSRSFFIELLSHHVERKILAAFELHQANTIMNGGGSLYILAGKINDYEQKLSEIDTALNRWLLKEFNTLLHVSFVVVKTGEEELSGNPERVLTQLSHKIYAGKNQKFSLLINTTDGDNAGFSFIAASDPHTHQCEICGNDRQSTEMVKSPEHEDQYICSLCATLSRMGNKLPDTHYFYPANQPCNDSIQIQDTWYIPSKTPLPGKECSLMSPHDSPDFFSTMPEQGIIQQGKHYIRKIADLKDIKDSILGGGNIPGTGENISLLKEADMAQLTHLAEAIGKDGAHYIGALRMDADNMGRLMRQGLYQPLTLHRLTAFSRQVHFFFKLAFPDLCTDKNVQLIYAGGDDLFLLGAWNDVLDIAIKAGDHVTTIVDFLKL